MKKISELSRKIYNILISAIIFLLPTNFFLKFNENTSYIKGLRVDYLIPKLYLTDILIIFLLLFWLFSNLKFFSLNKIKKIIFKNKLLISFLLIFFLRQLFSTHSLSSILYFFKIIELSLFGLFIIKNKNKHDHKIIFSCIALSLLFQSSIGIYQYLFQKKLFGYLLLGEPNLNNYIGIAKTTWFGIEKILPYGTTAHPNVLGGFLSFYILGLLNLWKLKLKNIISANKNLIFTTAMIILVALICLILTNSITAIATLLIGIYLTFIPKKITLKKAINIFFCSILISIFSIKFLAQIYPENQSFNRRDYLNTAAIEMTKNNLIIGVGLNNFTANIESYASKNETIRFVQPVHNIFLLFLTENGLLSLVILIVLAKKYRFLQKTKNQNWIWLLLLIPIANLDHYLMTINAGMIITTIFLSILIKKTN
ncbi:O-antigen ligase family protein [Candidatus Woesebacteria bacterium]|nr:O-antigen ligase family protein [Candidatus Woesebacteria bacterium]